MADELFLFGLGVFFGLIGSVIYQVMFNRSWFNKWQWNKMIKNDGFLGAHE